MIKNKYFMKIVDAEFIPISITLKYQELDAPG